MRLQVPDLLVLGMLRWHPSVFQSLLVDDQHTYFCSHLQVVGAIFCAATLALYCMVVASTFLHWWRGGSLFVAPCLCESKGSDGQGEKEEEELKDLPPDLGLLEACSTGEEGGQGCQLAAGNGSSRSLGGGAAGQRHVHGA